MACEAGVQWIQLRVKMKTESEWLEIALEARKITQDYNVTLIINDHVLIAKEVGADGVHLGRDDMYWKEARKIIGDDAIIGISSHSWNELLEAKEAQVDYAGLGPFRFTNTKEKLDEVLGKEGIGTIMKQAQQNSVTLPIIAIGGIKLNDVKELLEAGVNGVAVSSAINMAVNPELAMKEFLNELSISFSKSETTVS